MRIIAITGGVGSGKSRVLQILKEEFGAVLIIADEVSHQLMEPGEAGYVKVVEALGNGFLNPNGSVNRPKLASLIFSDHKARETVNGILHPMVWKRIQAEITGSTAPLIVLEAALMDEKTHDIYDEVWYVYTSEAVRINRLMADRGYTREKCRSIIASQMSEAEFRRISRNVIDNNGSTEETRFQIAAILKHEGLVI